jgi:hypothetical protein
MNKNVKIFIAVATAMIAAGMILSVVGLALGGFKSIRFGTQGFYVDGEAGFWDAKGTVSRSLDRFESINIDVDAYTVTLRKGDAYGITLISGKGRETPYIHEADGILTVRESGESKRQGGFFESWLSLLPLSIVHSDWADALIEITYPSGARFDEVNLEASAGSVDIVGLDAASLSVACAAGDLEIENAKLGDLSINLNAGMCEIEDTRADSAILKLDAGSFSAQDFECGPLRGDFRLGRVDVEGSLRGNVDISADVGDVSVRTDLPKSEYRLDLGMSLGNVTVDGHTVYEGDRGFSAGDASAPYGLRVKAAMGNVRINFD